ncbi:TPA: hypothetical protein P9G65_005140 [Pseudomonas aeruginosa]|nr:hypothetical protein [Pseudomonas aeruginosa]HDQ4722866.1 hypothetical protein [Pseudomonas aeruginosa]
MTKYVIEDDMAQPEPGKRGPKAARAAAKQAADAIRGRQYSSISDAARDYFREYEAQRPTIAVMPENQDEARNDRFKDFIAYIAEDLRSGPQSWHVMRVLGKRSKQQRSQPKEKQRRLKTLLNEMREVLKLPKL